MEYYLVKKERLDNFLKPVELNAKITLLNDCKLIDLSDEAIAEAAISKYGDRLYVYAQQREGYSAALIDLKQKL